VAAASDVVVVSSAMPPSMEAAELLAAAISARLAPPMCDLCDSHPGDAEGLTEAERIARFGPNSSFVPGAETWDAVRTRVAAALAEVTDRYRGSTIAVAAGSQLVLTSLVALGGMPTDDVGLVTRGGDKGSVTEWARLESGDVRRAGRWGLWRFNAVV
jgi:broad specificity phosphatase PhoE